MLYNQKNQGSYVLCTRVDCTLEREHKQSNFSIQNLLIEAGNNKKVARKVSFINKKNRKHRLYFGTEFILKDSTLFVIT